MTKYGFKLLREQEIPELNTLARYYRHEKTGAELLSLENADENKVFGICFRTPPSDSTGVPHIMEHSVLAGSRKYPVKDPFVELMKGSLNTFLNALTFPDKTCYPVASQNLQDFYNLIDVYLDSVFYPLISPYTLQQEGWHYELESIDQPLNIKGVVFNEMKGVYDSPDNLLGEKSQQLLFPDTAYGLDSGGDPEHIPDLTYRAFKSFHDRFYHPSNARIFFYGDDDPEERLRIVDEYLRDFEPIEVDSEIALQPRFSEPRRVVLPYNASESQGDQKAYITVNWLLPEVGDPEQMLGLSVLAHILVGGPASPLRKALIDSGLGEELAGVGLEAAIKQMFFSTGLKGIAKEDADKVEALIFGTLQKLVQDGIDPDTVKASLNTVEFRLRENNTGPYPRGVILMLRSLSTWLYDGDPLAAIAFEMPLDAIKNRLASGERVFENLIAGNFLNNPHRTTVILEPDPDLGKKREAAEREKLDRARAEMGETELLSVIENTQELKRRQNTPDSPEALATIPVLSLDDLDKEVRRIPIEVIAEGGSQILRHDLPTNGILYLDLGFDLTALEPSLLPYIPLFGRALLEMGTQKQDFVSLSQRIGSNTGGIRSGWFTTMVGKDERLTAWFFLRGKAMVPQTEELLAILRDVLLSANLDNRERFRQMALEAKASYETMLVPMGHRVINRRLRAHFNPADWATEQMEGVSALFFLRQLLEKIDGDWQAVLETLEEIRSRLINRQGMVLNATVDGERWSEVRPGLDDFLSDMPSFLSKSVAWDSPVSSKNEGLAIPTQVYYVGKGANLFDLGYQVDGSIMVIVPYLRNTWLWENVRAQGGAYGVFAAFDRHTGVFTFLSYRDPNLLDTLQAYDRSGDFLQRLDLSRPELTKAIITAIGEMDAYLLPDAQGYISMLRFLAGISDEERQQLRNEVLSTSVEDFHAFGDVLNGFQQKGQIVVLGSPDAIKAARAEGLKLEIIHLI